MKTVREIRAIPAGAACLKSKQKLSSKPWNRFLQTLRWLELGYVMTPQRKEASKWLSIQLLSQEAGKEKGAFWWLLSSCSTVCHPVYF